MSWRKLVVLLFVCYIAVFCQTTQPQPSPHFKGPVALVGGGPLIEGRARNMFIVGGKRDVVYAFDTTLSTVDGFYGQFVRSPNLYFPLEIPIDPTPIDAVTTLDGAWLAVLTAGSDFPDVRASINLINTSTYTLARADDGNPLRPDKPLGVGPTAIVVDPKIPGRLYVAMAGDEAVQVVDIVVTDNKPALVVGQRFTGVGPITRMTIDSLGARIYGADISGPYVHRLQLSTGAVSQIDVGAPSLDVLIAGRTPHLFVAKPDEFAIGIYDLNSGEHLDANPQFAPRLPDTVPFTDVYVAAVPSRLYESPLSTQWLCSSCALPTTDALERDVAHMVLVATDDGSVLNIDPDRQELVNQVFCQNPLVELLTTTVGNAYDGFNLPVDPCGTPIRANEQCSRTIADPGDTTLPHDAGIIVFPGYTPPTSTWRITYNAIVPGLDRSNGGGRLSTDGTRLSDTVVDLSLLPVSAQVGDIVTIASPPVATNESCQTTNRDFKVLAIDNAPGDDRLSMVLDKPAQQECFPNDVGYTVRLDNAHLLVGPDLNGIINPLARVHPGETYGTGTSEYIRFTAASDVSALTADDFFEFVISSPYERLLGGRVLDSTGTTTVTAGRLPSSIYVQQFGPAGTPNPQSLAYVAFAGNDVLIRYDPTQTSGACGAASLVQ